MTEGASRPVPVATDLALRAEGPGRAYVGSMATSLPVPPRPLLATLCADLSAHLPGIVGEWRALIDARARHGTPAAVVDGQDDPSELTRVVLDAALCIDRGSADYERALRTLLRVAGQHGATTRAQGAERDAVFTEYETLREAVWRHVRPLAISESGAAIVQVDDTLSVAIRASLQGYHRAELETSGQWTGAVQNLLDEALARRGA